MWKNVRKRLLCRKRRKSFMSELFAAHYRRWWLWAVWRSWRRFFNVLQCRRVCRHSDRSAPCERKNYRRVGFLWKKLQELLPRFSRWCWLPISSCIFHRYFKLTTLKLNSRFYFLSSLALLWFSLCLPHLSKWFYHPPRASMMAQW